VFSGIYLRLFSPISKEKRIKYLCLMRWISLTLFLVGLQTTCLAQIYLTPAADTERIKQACSLLQVYTPEIYEAVVQHATIQLQIGRDGEIFASTNWIEGGDPKILWIMLGTGSVRERSINRLAGTIFHESLHLLLVEERIRNGITGFFHELSETQQKEEELRIYQLEIELLTKMGTSKKEIDELKRWMEPYKDSN
jgi:hypothetical protein